MAMPLNELLDRTYTNAEFEAMPEFEGRYELIDGRIIEKPMPGDEHSFIAGVIYDSILLFDPAKELGRARFDLSYKMGQGWIPIPDLGYIKAERLPARSKKAMNVLPDLAIEILSPSQVGKKSGGIKVIQQKVARYLQLQIPLVWVIDPRNQTVSVYQGGNTTPTVLGINDELDGENIIPGFKLKISELF